MIELILVSHGSFAAGLREAAEMILGEQKQVSVLGVYQGDSPDSFAAKLEQLIDETGDPKNVLVLSDLQSGTPYNAGDTIPSGRSGDGRIAADCLQHRQDRNHKLDGIAGKL